MTLSATLFFRSNPRHNSVMPPVSCSKRLAYNAISFALGAGLTKGKKMKMTYLGIVGRSRQAQMQGIVRTRAEA